MNRSREAILLDPASLVAVRSLRLRARLVVDGLTAGGHRSPDHGFSSEFLEYRAYRHGEPASALDWRVFARNDRSVVRLFEDETNLTATIMLDASGSMAVSDTAVSKLEYARTIAAALAMILVRQRDATGLFIFGEGNRTHLPPSSSPARLRELMSYLQNAKPEGLTETAIAVDGVARTISRRGLCIIISDLLDDPHKIGAALRHLRFKRQEVLVIRILTESESHFSQSRTVTLIDSETGRTTSLDGETASKAFRNGFDSHSQILADLCAANGVLLETVHTNEPVGKALLRIMARRGRI